MHICIVAPEQIPVPPVVAGSVEICISALADKMARKHEITVISRSHPKLEAITKRDQLTIIRVPHKGSYIDSAIKVIREGHYDLIQVDNRPQYAARIKATFPKIPVALFLHSLTFVTQPHITNKSARAYLKSVDLIIANSQSLKGELESKFPNCRDRIHKTFLGVNSQTFRVPTGIEKETAKRKYGVHKTFNVLFVGRLVPRKGINVLIKAVRTLKRNVPNVRLLIAGGSPQKQYISKLKRYAKRLQVQTRFLGYVPHRKLPKVYWLGDCFVCPSQEHEAFGLVNVEAMASGVPVIASAIGGIKEIIKHGDTGLLVQDFRKSSLFSNSMLKLAKNPNYSASLGTSAHKEVLKRFTWEQAANRLEEIYSTFLKDR